MRKRLTKKQFIRRRRLRRLSIFSLLILIGVTGVCFLSEVGGEIALKLFHGGNSTPTMKEMNTIYDSLHVKEMLLTPNEYSRPQTKLKRINGVVIHYTANPGTDATANRNYFEGLKEGKQYASGKYIYTSSNFIIGLKGDIIECVPIDEVAYASNSRNDDTISIEVCHPDETGKFTKKSYDKLVELTAYFCSKYNLGKEDILRHYDISGKICPKYFVEHEDEWAKFKEDVFAFITKHAEE